VSVMSSRGNTYVERIRPARKMPGGMVEALPDQKL